MEGGGQSNEPIERGVRGGAEDAEGIWAVIVALAHALRAKGHHVLTEVVLDITFEGLLLPDAYKIDLLVNDAVLVEAKTVERLNAMHQAQVLTYLRLSNKEVGLLLNFWACPLKDGGIQRLVRTRK